MTNHLIIPGLAKAGTTFLFDQLAENTDIFNIPRRKELKFFQNPLDGKNKQDYLNLFYSKNKEKIFIDASPPYLYPHSIASDNIKSILPDDNIGVFILIRDPLPAVFSHYLHEIKALVGRLSSPRAKPSSYALDAPEVMRKFLHLKFPKIEAFERNYADSMFVHPMKKLFNGEVKSGIEAYFSIKLKEFDITSRSNAGGFVPRYFYGGEKGSTFEQDGILYKVPAYAMVSAAEERSEILHDVPQDVADRIFALASTFTKEITFQTSYFQSIIDDHMQICDRYNVDCPIKSNGATVEFQAEDGTVSSKILKTLEICN